MKQDKTDITVLLDRSGSMSNIRDDTIGGFNAFVEGQRKAGGTATLTLVQFDDQYEPVFTGKPLADVPALTSDSYVPRGSTALYDALCRSMDETGKRLSELPEEERPALVIFVIQTDGFENASKQYDIHAVNKRIAEQRDAWKWQFIYLGANQDAIAEAGKLGIGAGLAMSYGATPMGTAALFRGLTANIGRARNAAAQGTAGSIAAESLAWSEEQRKEQDEEILPTPSGGPKGKC